jgi:hypothetical protein
MAVEFGWFDVLSLAIPPETLAVARASMLFEVARVSQASGAIGEPGGLKMRRLLVRLLVGLTPLCWLTAVGLGQSAVVVEFPDPGLFYGNASFAVEGEVGYAVTYDNDTFWSFSLDDGGLLDSDGLALPTPGTASDVFMFPGDLAVIPGWFPDSSVFVADVSDPTNLTQAGIIVLPIGSSIQGQEIVVDESGYIGYVASFPNDRLYSFNLQTMALEDTGGQGGLALPGNPDRIALAGTRLAMVDTTNGRIMVADVSDPANLALAGTIDLPGTSSFNSDDGIVFASDGHTGFVTDNSCMLHSFDVVSMTALDPDGLAIASSSYMGGQLAIYGNTLACLWSRGLTLVDVSDPTDMTVICQANFGETVSTSPGGTVGFTADGTKVAAPICWPAARLYAFEAATGEQVSAPFEVDPYPFFTTVCGASDTIGALISNGDAKIYLVDGMFGGGPIVGDIDGDGDVDLTDLSMLLAAYGSCDGDPNFNRDADLDGNRCVDLTDLAELLSHYGEGTE